MGVRIGRFNLIVRTLRHIVAPDKRYGQTMWVGRVVEPKTAFNAQALFVAGSVAPLYRYDLVVVGFVGDLTANSAVWADALGFCQSQLFVHTLLVDTRCFHQRAGRTRLYALTTSDTGTESHRIVLIKDDLCPRASISHTDYVINLDFAAGAHAQVALDAGRPIARAWRDGWCRLR